jgi:hypothetical protein
LLDREPFEPDHVLLAVNTDKSHSPDALIALAMLTLGGLCPPLPGRVT